MSVQVGIDTPPLDPEIQAEFEAFVAGIGREMLRQSGDLTSGNHDAISPIFAHAHDLKGIGGTFGFDLLSDVAASLSSYIKRTKGTPDFRVAVVAAHVDAISRIIQTPMPGNGGADGVSMLARVKALASL